MYVEWLMEKSVTSNTSRGESPALEKVEWDKGWTAVEVPQARVGDLWHKEWLFLLLGYIWAKDNSERKWKWYCGSFSAWNKLSLRLHSLSAIYQQSTWVWARLLDTTTCGRRNKERLEVVEVFSLESGSDLWSYAICHSNLTLNQIIRYKEVI